jgi:hypothetical protein
MHVLARYPVVLGRLLLLISCSVLGCSPLVLAVRPPIDVDDYRGQGMIARIPNALNPGFSVDFESFILNAPVARVYAIDNLPQPRHHSPYQVAVAVDLTPQEDAMWPLVPKWLTTPGLGNVSFRVISRTGSVLARGSADLSDLYWQRFVDDMPYGTPGYTPDACHDDWSFPSSRGSDDSHVPMSLEVSYTPGSAAVARLARLRVMAGGRE